MANEGNLKPIQKGQLSKEEAKKRGLKGGKASGKSRREKRTMQEVARMILNMPCREGNVDDAAYMSDIYRKDDDGNLIIDEKTGKPIPKNLTMEQAGLIAIAKKAMDGDVKAMAFIRDTAGEKPIERVEISGDVIKASEEIDALIAEMDDDGK